MAILSVEGCLDCPHKSVGLVPSVSVPQVFQAVHPEDSCRLSPGRTSQGPSVQGQGSVAGMSWSFDMIISHTSAKKGSFKIISLRVVVMDSPAVQYRCMKKPLAFDCFTQGLAD